MRRRDFIGLVAAAVVAAPAAHAQHAQKIPRIGVLLPGTPESFALRSAALHTGVQPSLPFVPGPEKRRRASRSARSSRSTGIAWSRRRPGFHQEDANNMQPGSHQTQSRHGRA